MKTNEMPTELGAVASSISKKLRGDLGILERSGVVITSVKSGSIAERWGLRRGDVVKEVSGKTPTFPSEFMHFLATEGQRGSLSVSVVRVGIDRVIELAIEPSQSELEFLKSKMPTLSSVSNPSMTEVESDNPVPGAMRLARFFSASAVVIVFLGLLGAVTAAYNATHFKYMGQTVAVENSGGHAFVIFVFYFGASCICGALLAFCSYTLRLLVLRSLRS